MLIVNSAKKTNRLASSCFAGNCHGVWHASAVVLTPAIVVRRSSAGVRKNAARRTHLPSRIATGVLPRANAKAKLCLRTESNRTNRTDCVALRCVALLCSITPTMLAADSDLQREDWLRCLTRCIYDAELAEGAASLVRFARSLICAAALRYDDSQSWGGAA